MIVLRVIWAALREIFDEAAYDRFLAEHRQASSEQAFADFLEERKQHVERRPRCC